VGCRRDSANSLMLTPWTRWRLAREKRRGKEGGERGSGRMKDHELQGKALAKTENAGIQKRKKDGDS